MKIWVSWLFGAFIVASGTLYSAEGPSVLPPSLPENIESTTAEPDDSPQCVGGCATVKDDIPSLSDKEIHTLLDAYGKEEVQAATTPLETLLFNGKQLTEWLEENGTGALDKAHARFLTQQLSRTHVNVYLRIVGEDGRALVQLDGQRFPLGEKQHVHPVYEDGFKVPEISGTVKRVGLDHLWTRI